MVDARGFASAFVPAWLGDRGGRPDFVHFAAMAVADARGRLHASCGDPALPAFLRSSAKPFQAVALLRRGLDRTLGLSGEEVACACASHEGDDRHVAAAARILDAAGLRPEDLLCGVHAPQNADLERRVARGEVQVTPLHNNCSGKHAAMLATCRHEGWPLPSYPEPDHPLQQENLRTLAAFAGIPEREIGVATDNCTVPTFALPLAAAARAFARLREPDGLPAELAAAGAAAVAAMVEHPFFVGGAGRLDTALMEATRGRVVVKTGANGFHAGAGRSSSGASLGFAIKTASAEGEKAKAPIVIELLAATGLLEPEEATGLRECFEPPQRHCRGAIVGGGTFVAEVVRRS